MKLDPFYPILPSADWIERLVPRGIRLVQLRLKDAPDGELKAQIQSSQQVCTANNCLLVINDHWRAAIEYGCDAVHLGQEDADQADLPAIVAAGLKLGVSTHDDNELARAIAVRPDYIALGPIFGTTSKRLSWPDQGVERVTQWRDRVAGIPLVAIGGITLATAHQVLHAGADSVAVIGDVLHAADPVNRVDEWLLATQTGRR